MSGRMRQRLKGAVGWLSLEEMVRAEVEQARGHGISGLGLLEGIEDIVWELSGAGPASVAVMNGHRLTAHVDLSSAAVEASTPRSPQSLIIDALRIYRGGMLAGVELPQSASYKLPNGSVVHHRERHIVVFPDRVDLEAKELGRFSDVIPLHSV